MKETGLSSNNQYTPTDLLALTNFSRVRKMMDETMYGEVSLKFKNLTGKISQHSSSMTQIRDHDRYVYFTRHKSGVDFMLGYWLNSFNEKEYPDVSIVIEIGPKIKNRKAIIAKIKEIENSDGKSKLKSYNLDSPTDWAGIYLSRSLKSFLTFDDHIKEIQKFFLISLDKIDKVKSILED